MTMLAENSLSFSFFIYKTKELLSKLLTKSRNFEEYYLKLDGYFYSVPKGRAIAVIKFRNKRIADLISIKEIVNNKDYLKELHPVDACIIGIIANNERNGIINKKHDSLQKMCRFKDFSCSVKSENLLEILKTYTREDGTKMAVLKPKFLNTIIEIPILELCRNQFLLYALNSFEAISVGYEASESIFRRK